MEDGSKSRGAQGLQCRELRQEGYLWQALTCSPSTDSTPQSLRTRMLSVSPPSRAQAVIGAGAAGLVATRELLRENHHVTVFEQNNNVGGIWDYQEECETEDLLGRDPNRHHVHSSM